MKLLSLFIAMLIVVAAPAQNTISWVKKNGPIGGEIIDIEIDPSTGKIFLLDSDKRPYISTDNGASWERIAFPDYQRTFEDIEIANGNIFLVGSYELWASVDGGVTFLERMTQVAPYSGAYTLKRMPVSGTLVVLTWNGIYTSSNNGTTWTPGASLSGVDQDHQLAINAVDQIFILKQNGLFELRPFRSTDGGVSFSEVSAGIPAGHHVNTLASDPTGEKLFCITNENIFTSTDGSSWTSIKNGSITDLTISDVYPNNSLIKFSADGLGVFFIDNVNHKLHSKGVAAASWALRSSDFPSATLISTCAAVKDYPAANSATAYFGTPSGVFKTITGGASMSASNTGLASVKAEQIVSDGQSDGYLYLKSKLPTTNADELLKSIDRGNTWTKVSGLGTPLNYFTKTDQALFGLVVNQLYRSYNQGATWNALSVPTGGFSWVGAAGADKVFGLQHSGSPLSLYYSSNNGETWTVSAVAVTGLPTSFGVYESSIFFTSQQQMVLSIYDYVDAIYAYYRIDFLYDANEVITSATASKITTLPIPLDDIHKMTGANSKIFAYQAYGASADRLAVSSDGGISWTTYSLPGSDNFFAVANGYLFITENSSPDKLYISRDDGATWVETTIPPSVETYSIKDITLDNSGFAYLAMNGDYVYQSASTIVLPEAVSDLVTLGRTANAIALSWQDGNTYERDILIERSVDGVQFITVGQVNGWDVCNSGSGSRGYFVDSKVQPASTYHYRVKAKNAAGESAPSPTVMVTTLAACTQTIPENRSWSAINSGSEGYTLLPAPQTVGIKHLGGGKYQISNLTLGLTGSSEVAIFYASCGQTLVGETGGLNPNGNGVWDGATLTLKWRSCWDSKTETISLTRNSSDPVPAKPASLRAYVVSNTAVELGWTSGYYENSYVIERSLSPTSGFTSLVTLSYPATTYVDADAALVPGTTYYYRMKALNGNTVPDASPYSDVASIPFNRPNFTVAANAITNFKDMATLSSIWADFNNDGLMDYLTMQYDGNNEVAAPMIFKNLGTGDYEQIVLNMGSTDYFLPAVADYDNDNFPDIAFNGNESRVLDIFKGNGDFTFTKVVSGLGDLSVVEKVVAASSWGDINSDGLADLLVLSGEDGSFAMYRQNANHSFTKVYQAAPSSEELLVAIWADYDNDGFQDFLLSNNNGPGSLYRNNGDETFTKVSGNGFDGANYFSAAWGDYNNDGNMDIFCGSTAMNALYKNNGDGTFTKDVSTSISEANFTFAASWGDYNNDRYLDLMVVSVPFNGSQSRLFLRDPSVTSSVAFKKITTEKINDISVAHYSVANADPDQNGQLDIGMSAFLFDDSNDGLLPTNNNFYQNNNTLANWSEVKLNPATGSREGLGARITLTAGGSTQVREIAASSSLVSRNSTIAHFGLGSASTITNISVRWPNGSVQNYPSPPINQILIIDEDVQGPILTSKAPVHNATDVSVTTSLTLIFDEEIFPVSGKKIEVTKVGESTPHASIDVTAGAKSGTQIVYTLPLQLQGVTQYRVTVEPGAFRDRWVNASAAVGPLEWRFTTVATPDVTAPQILFTAPTSLPKAFGTVNPTLTVTDDVGVSTVVISIRKISGSGYTDINAAPGSEANTYSVTLQEGQHFDATGAEFYITATDAAGNANRDPDTGTHKIYLTYNEVQSAIPSTVLGFGGMKKDWKVFAIPFELSHPDDDIINIFNELATLDSKKDYRLITINDARNDWKEYSSFTKIVRGQGYFINIRTPITINLYDDLTTPQNSKANLFGTTLKPGWNMIGNPYLTQIDWADVAAYNGLSGDAASLVKYTGTAYAVSSQVLAPYEGGFINNPTTSDIVISIPFDGQTTSGGRTRSIEFPSDINKNEWMLKLNVHQQDSKYEMGAIGMSPEANPSLDAFDRVTPPRFFDYLELNFSHPEHFQKRFTRDVVPTQSAYTWEFTVESNLEGQAEIHWDNSEFSGGVKDLYLLDISSEKLVNMKETSTFRFNPNESRRFRIYYGDNLNIAPESVHLGRAYPNPTSAATVIPFSLPESGGVNQNVVIEVLDNLGRTVGKVTEGTFNPGYHETSFDATGMVKGLYTYRLTVKTKTAKSTQVNKLMIK